MKIDNFMNSLQFTNDPGSSKTIRMPTAGCMHPRVVVWFLASTIIRISNVQADGVATRNMHNQHASATSLPSRPPESNNHTQRSPAPALRVSCLC